MTLFAEIIDSGEAGYDESATLEDYKSIAVYFEGERNNLQVRDSYLIIT